MNSLLCPGLRWSEAVVSPSQVHALKPFLTFNMRVFEDEVFGKVIRSKPTRDGTAFVMGSVSRISRRKAKALQSVSPHTRVQ